MTQVQKTTTTTTHTVVRADGSKTTTTTTKTIFEAMADLIKASGRPSPQDDFYMHANYAWLSDPSVEIPAEYPTWGSFMMLRDASLKNQISLLEDLISRDPATLTVDEAKLAALWKASMDRFKEWSASSSAGSYAPVHDALALIDSHLAQNTDEALASYFGMSMEQGLKVPFEFDQMANMEDSKNTVLVMAPEGRSLPSRDYYFEDNFKEKREFFVAHLEAISKLVGADRLAPDFANAVLRFETKLAYIDMKPAQARQYTKYYTITTIDKIASGMNELKSLEEKLGNYGPDGKEVVLSDAERERISAFLSVITEKLNLPATLQDNYAKNYPEGPADAALRAIVFDGDYFRRVFAVIFDEANRDDLRAYLQYRAIFAASDFCTQELNEEVFDLYARKFSGQKEQKSEEKRSIALINDWIGFLNGKVYVDRYFSVGDKQRVSDMIAEVVQVMDVSIAGNDWLTAGTKENAKEKLSQFKTKIGFPDKWVDYDQLEIHTSSNDTLWDIRKRVLAHKHKTKLLEKINAPVDKTEWFMTPQTVNAYYSPLANEICFPAAIIQPPFYAKSIDAVTFEIDAKDRALINDDDLVLAAVNFGGIAAVIAHEITHGFDDQGRSFDGTGNVKDWWVDEDANLFQAKCDVMEKQKWSFTDPATGKVHELNPKLTMGENLADLGGISLSCQALLKRIEGRENVDRNALLRVLFHSWANVWRTKASDAYLVNQLATDPHSPPNVRGNLVKNVDYFYEAFGVKEGDAMYLAPSERVVMW
ncbi:hypothetical protein BJ741DRAFT_638433 [Chytriomyces cf. hyalinus JEL632]|nr:hypothetical protein BJ741DRAFT_638433 [Chytriomyces cf. hyalinus JEL632]